jgi:hypothetical protein
MLLFKEIAMKYNFSTTGASVPTMHAYLSNALAKSGKSVEQMATEIGDGISARVLQMMLDGEMKFHYKIIEAIARTLDLDPVRLLRLLLANQTPELLQLLDRLAAKGGPDLLTTNERRLIERVREYTAGTDAVPVINDASTVVALVML